MPSDPNDIRDPVRDPDPEEIAAVTAVLSAALDELGGGQRRRRENGGPSAWQRSQRGVRSPLVRVRGGRRIADADTSARVRHSALRRDEWWQNYVLSRHGEAQGIRSRTCEGRALLRRRPRFRPLSPGSGAGFMRTGRKSGSDRGICPLVVPRNDDFLLSRNHGILED